MRRGILHGLEMFARAVEGYAGLIPRAARVPEVTLRNGGLTGTLTLPAPGLQLTAPMQGVPAKGAAG